MKTIEDLKLALEKFAQDREWSIFHTPKNLSMCLTVEAAELQELFMWLTPEESVNPSESLRAKVSDEVGDVLICLLNFCRSAKIDALEAAFEKLKKNEAKYPVEKSRGSSKKYTEL
jgi:dCTP diphosphatase